MKLLARSIDVITIIIAGMIGIRIVLKLLGASTVAPFVQWLYALTGSLLTPFAGIFTSPRVGISGELDIPALFGVAIYMLIGYFVSQLIRMASREIKTPKIFKHEE